MLERYKDKGGDIEMRPSVGLGVSKAQSSRKQSPRAKSLSKLDYLSPPQSPLRRLSSTDSDHNAYTISLLFNRISLIMQEGISNHSRSFFFMFFFGVIGCIFIPFESVKIFNVRVWKLFVGLSLTFAISLVAYSLEHVLMAVLQVLDKTFLWPIWFYASCLRGYLAPLMVWIVLLVSWGDWFDEEKLTDGLQKSTFSVSFFENVLEALVIITALFIIRQLVLNLIFWEVESKGYVDRIAIVTRNDQVIETLGRKRLKADSRGGSPEPLHAKRFDMQLYNKMNSGLVPAKETQTRTSSWTQAIKKGLKVVNVFGWKSSNLGLGQSNSLTSKEDTRKFARTLFDHIVSERAEKVLTLQHFRRFFSEEEGDTEAEADQIFLEFVREDNQTKFTLEDYSEDERKLDRKKFVNGIIRMRRKRLDLVSDLQRSSSATSIIGNFLTWLTWLATPFIVASQLGASSQSIILTTSTVILSLAFALGTVISRLVESVYFIFVTRPYQVGDVVLVGSTTAERYVVLEIEMMTTTFRTWANRLVILPNYLVASGTLVNFNRLPNANVKLLFRVSIDTDPALVTALRLSFEEYLKAHVKEWLVTSLVFYVRNVENVNSMDILVWVTNRRKWQEYLKVMTARSEFLNFARSEFGRLNIRYSQVPQKLEFDASVFKSVAGDGKCKDDNVHGVDSF